MLMDTSRHCSSQKQKSHWLCLMIQAIRPVFPGPHLLTQIWCAGHGELVQETPNLIWSLTATWSLSETRPGWNLSVQSGSFSLLEVTTSLNSMKVSSPSVGFPRSAIKAHSEPLLLVSWALINAIAALGAQPSFWFREVCPIRKRGSGPVLDTGLLWPVTTMDDVECLLDGAWLSQVRSLELSSLCKPGYSSTALKAGSIRDYYCDQKFTTV